jgi:hypothetical protein
MADSTEESLLPLRQSWDVWNIDGVVVAVCNDDCVEVLLCVSTLAHLSFKGVKVTFVLSIISVLAACRASTEVSTLHLSPIFWTRSILVLKEIKSNTPVFRAVSWRYSASTL